MNPVRDNYPKVFKNIFFHMSKKVDFCKSVWFTVAQGDLSLTG